ncbi:MAG: glycosyltransferase family 39 protein, partial [Bryobacteraceae bacterium]
HVLEEDLLAFVTGAACVSTLVFFLCAAHLARKGAFTILAAAVIAAAWKTGATARSRLHFPPVSKTWLWAAALPVALYTWVYFFNALAPEASPDGATYHLGNVVRWWHDRGFVRYSGSMYADLSQGLEMLFLVAFSYGRHSAATLVHFSFLIALPWLIWCYGRRFDMVQPAVVGALLIYLSPVTGRTGTAAYNDLAALYAAFALFYVLDIWLETSNDRFLYVAGVLAGFCYATKYTAAVGMVYAIAIVTWRCFRSRRNPARPLLMMCACAACIVLPWMVKNWVWFGNPFSPFLNHYFPNPHITVWFEEDYRAAMSLYGEMKSRRELPWFVTLNGAYVGGLFGPWLLLAPLALFAINSPRGRRFLLASVIFGLPALTNNTTRLLLPFAVFIAMALGIVLTRWKLTWVALVLQTILCWPAVVGYYASPWAWRLTSIPYAAALRRIPQEKYLQEKLSGYRIARAIEQLVPQGERVLLLQPVPQAYTTRRLWNWYESAEGIAGQRAVWAGQKPGMQPNLEIKFQFPERTATGVRVIETAAAREQWSVNEMRLYRQESEVKRQPGWRISATPNHWEAFRAFDNGPISAWSTSEAIAPGMHLQVEFDHPIHLDRVSLLSTPGEWRSKLAVETRDSAGKWNGVAAQAIVVDNGPPVGMRRLATDELKALGFSYVVAGLGEAPGRDMHHFAPYWSISCVFEGDGACLYRLE